jgi:hypothetical protein
MNCRGSTTCLKVRAHVLNITEAILVQHGEKQMRRVVAAVERKSLCPRHLPVIFAGAGNNCTSELVAQLRDSQNVAHQIVHCPGGGQ